jgi:dihydroxy-acid dehydratase
VAPEALDGGPIALVEEDDLIEINIPQRRLAVVGTGGEHKPPDVIGQTLAGRREIWKPPRPRHDTGILSLYSRVARGAAEGASIT